MCIEECWKYTLCVDNIHLWEIRLAGLTLKEVSGDGGLLCYNSYYLLHLIKLKSQFALP